MIERIRKLREAGWPLDVMGLLAALAGLQILFQYYTLEKFQVLRPDVRYTSLQGFLSVVREFVPLGMWDRVLALLILGICIYLVVLEARKARLSTFLGKVFESERRTHVLLALGGLVLVRFYFARGEFSWAADTYLHATYAWVSAQAFAQGEVPIWTNFFCAGTPYLQFYGFLFYYLVGLAGLAFRDAFLATKAVLAAGHVLSGLGAYLFVRRLTGSRQAGVMAGAAYVLCFWHTQQVLILGRLPLSLFYALLPFPFYCFESLRKRENRLPYAIGGGLALGCLAFTHPGYGFWATAFLGLYMAIRFSLCRKGEAPFPVGPVLLLFFGGAVFGAYLTVPMYLEREYTGLHTGFYMTDFPSPTWRHLLLWSNYRVRLFGELEHWYGGYLGITLVGLAGVGLVRALKGAQRGAREVGLAAAVCLIGSLVLVFGYRWPVIRSLGVVQALSAGRYLLFVTFFLSVTAGVGAALLMAGKADPTRALALLLIAVMADLGPTTFQHPYRPRDIEERIGPEALRAMGRYPNAWALVKPLPLQHLPVYRQFRAERAGLPPGELPNYRVFHTTNRIYYHFIIPWLAVNTGVPTPLDTFTQYPLSVPAFVRRFQDLFHRSVYHLEEGQDPASLEGFESIRAGLFLLNTRHVLFSQAEQEEIRHLAFPEAGPVVVAPRIAGWNYPVVELDRSRARSRSADEKQARQEQEQALGDFLGLLRAMAVNVADGTCRQILLADYEGEEDLGTLPRVEVLEHRVWNQRVVLRVRVSEACFARLAYTHYPYQRVTVNGREVTPYRTAGHFVALRLEAGERLIVLEPELSPLRFALLLLDLGLLAAAGVALMWARARRR